MVLTGGDIIRENQISAVGDELRIYNLLESMKLLQISKRFHIFTSGIWPMSNPLTEKEVHYESIECIKNLDGLSPQKFQKKYISVLFGGDG